MDNKYDQSFKKSELGVTKESIEVQMDDNSDRVVEAINARNEYFAREPENFGRCGGWI